MQWDDILDENRDDALNQKYSIWCDEHLDINQALISLKKSKNFTEYSINREYINSYEYYDKFENLPLRKEVKKALYKETGRLLEFVNGLEPEQQLQERLTVINAETGKPVVDNFNRDGNIYNTGLTDEEYQKIIDCPNPVILIHNHSLNGPPSGRDISTLLHKKKLDNTEGPDEFEILSNDESDFDGYEILRNPKIAMSVIACHNGDIYAICDVKPEFNSIYCESLRLVKEKTTNKNDIKRLAMDDIYMQNEIASPKRKLFDIKIFKRKE